MFQDIQEARGPVYGPLRAAVLGGVGGALLMSALLVVMRAVGLTAFNLELALGNRFVTGTIGPYTWFLGLLIHACIGAVFGLFYGLLFKTFLGPVSIGLGLALGALHWAVAGFVIAAVPQLQLVMPGGPLRTVSHVEYFFSRDGLCLLLAHMVYGATVAHWYAIAAAARGRSGERSATDVENREERSAA